MFKLPLFLFCLGIIPFIILIIILNLSGLRYRIQDSYSRDVNGFIRTKRYMFLVVKLSFLILFCSVPIINKCVNEISILVKDKRGRKADKNKIIELGKEVVEWKGEAIERGKRIIILGKESCFKQVLLGISIMVISLLFVFVLHGWEIITNVPYLVIFTGIGGGLGGYTISQVSMY